MKLKKSTFENAPEGTHAARITTLADLGIQRSAWQGAERQGHKLGITFELVNKRTKGGAPFAVFDRVSLSLNERSRLYEIAQAALGRVPDELDLGDLLGRPVLVTIIHREAGTRVYANVDRVTGIPEGMDVPESPSPRLYFDLDAPDPAIFAKLPALFRKLIEERVRPTEPDSSEEPEKADTPRDFDDDIPF